MKISTKLGLGFLVITITMISLALYANQKSQDSLHQAVGNSSMFLAQEMLNGIDRAIYLQTIQIQTHMEHSNFQNAVVESNNAFEELEDLQTDMENKGPEPFPGEKLISKELSSALEREFISFYEKKYGYRIFGELLVTNRYGAIVAHTNATDQYMYANEIWWKKARDEGVYTGDIKYQENIDSYGIEIGIPIHDNQKNFMGVVKAFLVLKGIIQTKESDKKKYKTTQIKLFTKTGQIIYGSKEFIPLEDQCETSIFKDITGPDGFFIARANGEREKLISHVRSQGYGQFKGLGWILAMSHDAEEVFAPVIKLRNNLIFASAVLIFLGIIIYLLLMRSIARPLAQLTLGTKLIGRGYLDHRMRHTTNDEIGSLGKAFNGMLDKLQKSENTIKEYQEGLENLVKNRNLSLKKTNKDLTSEILEKQKKQERILHLNSMLKALRSINRLIIIETDTEKLIQKTCDILISTRGYDSAWIALFDKNKKPIAMTQAGLDEKFQLLKDFLETSKGIICDQRALEQPGIKIIQDPSISCTKCPLAKSYRKFNMDLSGMRTRLESSTSVFGIISVSLAKDLVQDKKEQSLFLEISNDIAFALKNLETETQKKELEAQFLQAQKMESIGTLAGGVAHDFNNILAIIIGNSDMALDELNKENPLYQDLVEILNAGKRGASLTRQLLAFSRKQVIQPANIHMNTIIENLEKMISRMIGEDVAMNLLLDPNLGYIMADTGQMEQIIMNLAANARDAMPGGGELTIETMNMDLKENNFIDHGLQNQAGPFVMISVRDSGMGMDKETQKRIFEPFFTTKELGRGTGLGMSTVYGIIKQNHGFVFLESQLNQGTVFKIFFPRTEEKEMSREKPEKVSTSLDGKETILVVEDDDMLRSLVSRIIQARGYRVLDAWSGEDALAKARMHKEPIDLMLTDMVMPGMNGNELAESMSGLRPEMKLIYMSGYIDNPLVRQSVKEKKAAFLQKPFKNEKLLEKLRQVLDN